MAGYRSTLYAVLCVVMCVGLCVGCFPELPNQTALSCESDGDCRLGYMCEGGKCVSSGKEPVSSHEKLAEPVNNRVDSIDSDLDGGAENTRDGFRPEHLNVGRMCMDGETRECTSYPGASFPPCKKGIRTCKGSRWPTECVGEVGPKAEVCNGKDDNCNGKVDDIDNAPCYEMTAKTPCFKGVSACQSGQKICKSNTNPQQYISCKTDEDCRQCGGTARCKSSPSLPNQGQTKYCLP